MYNWGVLGKKINWSLQQMGPSAAIVHHQQPPIRGEATMIGWSSDLWRIRVGVVISTHQNMKQELVKSSRARARAREEAAQKDLLAGIYTLPAALP